MSRELAARLVCYLITDSRVGSPERVVEIAEQALRGGVTAVQVRLRGWTDRACLEAAVGLRALTHRHDALLIVNDRVDLALACDADGVHLGVGDLPVAVARKILGERATIGYSPEGIDDARQAADDGADYLGVGPVYPTASKADAGNPIGVAGIRRMADAVALPIIGVGGITTENARAVVEAGAVGVAVVGSVFLAPQPEHAARLLRDALMRVRQ